MKDITTLEMQVRPLFFFRVYFNVPGGDELVFNNDLIKLVQDIGNKFGTVKGSALKKGIHYIKNNTGASSKREIKMMLRNAPNAFLVDENDCRYVFRCSNNHFVEIFKFIVEKSKLTSEDNLSEKYLHNQMIGFRYVAANGTTEEKINIANDFLDKLCKI